MTEPSEVRVALGDEGVAELVLNRTERKNALTRVMATELRDVLSRLNDDPAVRCIVLRGSGAAFCSGLDLDHLRSGRLDGGVEGGFARLWTEVHRQIWRLRKPLVGALERFAINGGASLALACDFLIAGETAFLQVGEVRVGMAAPMNLHWLRAKWGLGTATRVALLGDRIPGPRLVELGLAFQSADDAEVRARAAELAAELAAFEPQGPPRILEALRPAAGEP